MLVDKLIKRKIDLLDLLNDSEGLSMQELQEKLKLTGKTIRSELKELLVDCPYSKEDISIEKHGSKYILKKKDAINIETIKTNFKKGSLFFQMYCYIFQENFLLSGDSSNQYFCSRSKMYKEFKLLKKYVNSKGVGINRNDSSYYLKGAEMLIRFQAFHYFWEISRGMGNLLSQDLRGNLEQVVCEIETELRMDFSYLDRERLICWLWISKTRTDLGKYVENKKYYEETSSDFLNIEKVKKKIELFMCASTEVNLKHEVNFLLLILKITLEKSLYNKRREPKHKTDVLYLGSKFVNEFREKFDVKKETISISFLIGEALFYHQNLDIRLLNTYVEKYPRVEGFNQKFDLFFSNFSIENDLKISNSEKLYAYLYGLCYEHVNLNSYKPLLHLTVICSDGEFNEYRIKQELLKLNFNLEVEEKNIELSDLIITDYVNIGHEDKLFYCSSTFSPRMIVNLEIKLRKLEQNKWVIE